MIIFENEGLIDSRAITTFGVSVKEGENPIGFFGTGLKYAIAILLREGQSIHIHSGEETYNFSTQMGEVRGKSFQFIYMNDQPLGFTTELGKTWQLWQAMRELYCNTIDEGGKVFHSPGFLAEDITTKTVIVVTGRKFRAVFDKLGDFILQTSPVVANRNANIHAQAGSGIYFRGMLVEDRIATLHTYDVQTHIDLTEDRTAKYGFQLRYAITHAILQMTQVALLEEILLAEEGTYESTLDFQEVSCTPSATFLEVVEDLRKRKEKVNLSASRVLIAHRERVEGPEKAAITSIEVAMIANAVALLVKAGYEVGDTTIEVYEFLGESVLGTIKGNRIHLSRLAFAMGQRMVTGTILEEWLHISMRLSDCSRGMQNYLFDSLIARLEVEYGEARKSGD